MNNICSLYINCGDYDVTVNNTNYEGDTERKGPSSYYNAGNWAFSSTGAFVYDIRYPNTYILSNTSNLNNISTVNTALYTKARTAANSLTYYGLCLMNGHYTVRLHFAEIVFTEYSPRKRVFDVYVQGELKLKDFDIIKEAGGIGRELIKSYTVNVKNNTLKIQLYWAGKGKPNFPLTETNGPIISAISVDASK
ncbi:putative Malectin domain-containing protein [Helianthus annuus]|uniref:Malectin domain-containing protein n=1 Tax=Helianthus annuus TaxID=4232 RepID=A0A9K3JKN5_HELAN|nr:putative Malectin domain-containing protein [Helianthus annuus]KAJ0617303.1 putative Malectin domain-containing protein [Helianthus annuus]KAJ0938195.1 putative Malectin domain-containing protein [Helianthus annuus]KAJ0950222.1 putative Malectin domain-containing protein [Helianthus annuus]